MAVIEDLSAFLGDIAAKDDLLRKAAPSSAASAALPPIRGQSASSQGAPAKAPAKAPTEPPADASAIWDGDEAVASAPAPASFVASATFTGVRPGFVFKKGPSPPARATRRRACGG